MILQYQTFRQTFEIYTLLFNALGGIIHDEKLQYIIIPQEELPEPDSQEWLPVFTYIHEEYIQKGIPVYIMKQKSISHFHKQLQGEQTHE